MLAEKEQEPHEFISLHFTSHTEKPLSVLSSWPPLKQCEAARLGRRGARPLLGIQGYIADADGQLAV